MVRIKPVSEDEFRSINENNLMLYDDFLANNVELSDETLKVYRSNLKVWFWYVHEFLGDKDHVKVKSIEFKRFQNWMVSRGCSSSDVAAKRSAISSLNNYIEIYYGDDYPTFRNFINSAIKKPEKSFVYPKEPPTLDELNDMIRRIEESTNIKDKWQKIAYLKFTFDTGCRRAESVQLTKDIVNAKLITKKIVKNDENGNEITLEAKYYLTDEIRCKGRGKTGKVRRFKISEDTMEAIKKWLEVRGDDDCPYVFVSKRGDKVSQISKSTINKWGRTVFTPLLGRRFHPHCLREARATDIVIREGKNIKVAQSLLGHNSSETTEIYVISDSEDEESDELFI